MIIFFYIFYIFIASTYGYADCVLILLKYGTQINLRSSPQPDYARLVDSDHDYDEDEY